MSTLAVNTLTPSTGSSVSIPAFVPSSQFSHRNKIINGKMEVAQRGTTFSVASNAVAYTLDRWNFGNSSTAAFSVTQNTTATGEFQRNLQIQVTTADATVAATDYAILKQALEGYTISDLFGKTFTISFWVKSSKTGTHCLALRNTGTGGTPDRSYIATYTVTQANTFEYKTITIAGGLTTGGIWDVTNGYGLFLDWVLASGTTYQTTGGTWQTGNFIATSAQVNVMDTVGNIFAITGVQLEAGSVATPFEHRPYAYELDLCYRYFYRLSGSGSFVGSMALCGTGTSICQLQLPKAMRASAQAVTLTGNFTLQDNTSSSAATFGSVGNTSTTGVDFSVTHSTLTNNTVRRLYLADSNANISVSAE